MLVIGIDAHKRTHTAVAVDIAGSRGGVQDGASNVIGASRASCAGPRASTRTVASPPRTAWHLTRGLERDLLGAGETLVRVSAQARWRAHAAALAPGASPIPSTPWPSPGPLFREPGAADGQTHLDGPAREVRLLLDRREDLVAQRTRQINRLRWHLHELDPALESTTGSLTALKNLDALGTRLACRHGVVAEIAADLVVEIRQLSERANHLERQYRGQGGPPGSVAAHPRRLRGTGGRQVRRRDR